MNADLEGERGDQLPVREPLGAWGTGACLGGRLGIFPRDRGLDPAESRPIGTEQLSGEGRHRR
jgi:hypothetical protein